MNDFRNTLIMLAALLTAGCFSPTLVQQPTSARPATTALAPAGNGAIYQGGAAYRPLFEDRRARNVGDTLVININENTAAKKDADTSASRSGSVQAAVPTIQGIPAKSLQGLGINASSDSKFEGKGASAANNAFTGTITVTVIEVLPNGNMVVAGEKQLGINQGSEYIRISGVVNPANIVGNAVSSVQVADARIEYRAKGYIDEAQAMGWLARFFLAVLPF